MEKAKIQRINELARKSRTTQLTPEELAEQKALRDEYRAGFKRDLMQQLDNTYVIDEYGNKTKLVGGKKK